MRIVSFFARRVVFAAVAATALTTGCSDMPWSQSSSSDRSASGAGPDRQCQVFRSYRDRPYVDLMEACTRQMGEEACRRCLQ
jgi:hypothetical protein